MNQVLYVTINFWSMQILPLFHEKWLVSFCTVACVYFGFNPMKFNPAADHGFAFGHSLSSLPRGTDGFLNWFN
jgi:hypothetical protein